MFDDIRRRHSGQVFAPAKTKEDLEKVEQLKKNRLLEVKRPLATETDTLNNWFSKVYLVYKDGNLVGYAGGKFFGAHNLEIMYVEGGVEEYIKAASAYRIWKKIPILLVEVLPTEKDFNEAMSQIAEEYSIKSIYKYKVFSYEKLFKKLIAITLQFNPSLSYNGVVEIEGREKLKIVVGNGEYVVEKTDEEASVTYSEKSAIAWLLGAENGPIPLAKISLRHSDFI